MKARWWSWVLVLALAVTPRWAAGQCGGGMMGGQSGGHQHEGSKSTGADKKTQQAIGRVLADERGRAQLMDAIFMDVDFMRQLVGRLAESPEWRALAIQRLGEAPPLAAPARSDTAASTGAARAPAPATAVYRCPMHPEVTSDRPGKCPKCGMTLERAG